MASNPEDPDVPVHMGSIAWDLGWRVGELAHELLKLSEADAADTNRAVSAILPGTTSHKASVKRYRQAHLLLSEVSEALLGHAPWDGVDRACAGLTKRNEDPAALRLRQSPALEACAAAIRAWPTAETPKQRKAIVSALTNKLRDCDAKEFRKLTERMVFDTFEQAEARQRPPKLRANHSRILLLESICEKCGAWPNTSRRGFEKR